MKSHEAAKIFPMLPEAELRGLAADIKEHGLTHSIITLDGTILDGRNRYRACEIAGVKPRLSEAGKVESPTAYVISANLKRRHLNDAQKAVVAAECEVLFAKEAKARQVEAGKLQGGHGKEGGRGKKKPLTPGSGGRGSGKHAGESASKAAKAVGAGRDSTQAMIKVRVKAPDVFEAVKSGAVTKVSDAVALSGLSESKRQDPRATSQRLG